jgi:hypothetical protein
MQILCHLHEKWNHLHILESTGEGRGAGINPQGIWKDDIYGFI